MNAVTVWLVPLLLAVAILAFATGGVVIAASRDHTTSVGFRFLWVGVGSLVAAAASVALPMLVLALGARPA